MTAAATLDVSRARPWLRRCLSAGGYDGRAAGLFTILDSVAAIGFAAGLAWALSDLAGGPARALPGAALMAAAGLARGLFSCGASGAAARSAVRVKSVLRAQSARGSLFAPRGDRSPVGALLTVVVDGVEALDGWYSRYAPAETAARLAPVLVIGAMMAASPIAGGIVLATFIPFIAAMALAGSAAAEASRRQLESLTQLSGQFGDRIRNLPVVLAFGAERRVTAGLARTTRELSRRTLAVLKIAFVSSASLEFFAALSVALVAVYCGFNLLHLVPFPVPERLTLARAMFVLALAPEAYAPFRRLAAAYHERQAAETASEGLIALAALGTPRATQEGGAPQAIDFAHVGVTYPDQDGPALAGFSLSIAAGEAIALMGPSGAGKSTLLNLLLGLAPLTEGSVSIDGAPLDLQNLPCAAWAGQSPVVFPGSLLDNIRLGDLGADDERILDVARGCGLTGLRGGLERPIDERGGGLSAGERRRLSLARAALSSAPLLLLDEPTANLDAASEAALLPIIRAVARGRTTLIATHSPTLAALADRIVRLDT